MRINDTSFKSSEFKSSAVDDQKAGQTPGTDDSFDPTMGLFGSDLGVDEPGAAQSDANTNPLSSYTIGEVDKSDRKVTSADAEMSHQRLSKIAIDWNDLMSMLIEKGVTNPDDYLTIIKDRYEKAAEVLRKLKDTYERGMSGSKSTEVEDLKERLDIVNQGLANATRALDTYIPDRMQKAAARWDMEKAQGIDIDGNGWAGQANAPDSLMTVLDANGNHVLVDPTTKQPVPMKIFDANYPVEITGDNSLAIVDEKTAGIPYNGKTKEYENPYGNADLILQLQKLENTYDNRFQTPIDLGVPEYILVKADPSGKITAGRNSLAKTTLDGAINGQRMEPMRFVADPKTGAVTQVRPKDMSGVVQVQVTRVEIFSKPVSDKLNDIYNTYIDLYASDGTLITRIEVVGRKDTTSPASHSGWLAPSSVGFSVHPANSLGRVEIDATGYMSTNQHKVGDLAQALGDDVSDSRKAALTHNEKPGESDDPYRKEVTDKEHRRYYSFQRNMWVHEGKDDDGKDIDFKGYQDRFVASDDKNELSNDFRAPDGKTYTKYNTRQTNVTGIYFNGFTGIQRGTNFNDVFRSPGVSDVLDKKSAFYNEYVAKHIPENLKHIDPKNPFFANIVYGGGGNNVFVGGSGKNYAMDMTFAYVKAKGNGNENFISTPKVGDMQAVDKDGIPVGRDTSTYVHVEGADANILNVPEFDMSVISNTAGADPNNPTGKEDAVNRNKNIYRNDYYEVIGGAADYANARDEDIVGTGSQMQKDHWDGSWLEDEAEKDAKELLDVLNKAPTVDPATIATSLEARGKMEADLAAEMDGFFNEAFPDGADLFGDVVDQAQYEQTL